MKLLALLAVLSACDDKHVDVEVAEVNAFVPVSLRNNLDFVMRDVDDALWKQKWKVPAPRSWVISKEGDLISAPPAPVSASVTQVGSFIRVYTGPCPGLCSRTPSEQPNKLMHERYRDFVTNGKHLQQRIMRWTERFEEDAVHISVVTWAAERPTYRSCEARLERELADAQEAFEAACVIAAIY